MNGTLQEERPELKPDSRFSTKALLNSVLRIFVGLLVFVGGFLFLIPELQLTFEEFGVDLPLLSQMVMSLSERAISISFVFLPVVIVLLIVAEIGLLSIPNEAIRKILNILAWLVLFVAIILFALALGIPLIQVMGD